MATLARNISPNVGKCITLSTGAKMPIFGLGTWQSKPGEVEVAVDTAIRAGYRHIDGAWNYKNEHEIGNALQKLFQEGVVKREDIFVTTKISGYFYERDQIAVGLKESLKDLQLDYADMVLVHQSIPVEKIEGWRSMIFPIKDGKLATTDTDHLVTWQGMEDVYEAGLAKAIGISNFNTKQIQNIIDHCKIKPHNLQVECHAYFNQAELHEWCRERDIAFTAYAPIGSPGRGGGTITADNPTGADKPSLMEHMFVKSIANKHNKTPAQILLRYLMQREIMVIPKSTNPKRIRENFDVWNFSLTDDDFKNLNKLPQERMFDVPAMRSHRYYPFGEV